MAGVSISHMVLFIASIVVAASVVGVLTTQVNQISAAIDDQGVDLSKEIRADIEPVSDAGSTIYNRDGNNNITVLVKNTGSRELTAEQEFMTVLVNGTYITDYNVSVVDGSRWEEGNVVRIEISLPNLGTGDHRVKLIVNGDEELFRFDT